MKPFIIRDYYIIKGLLKDQVKLKFLLCVCGCVC